MENNISQTIDLDELVNAGIHGIRIAIKESLSQVEKRPHKALKTIRIGRKKQKKALAVDLSAENTFEEEIQKYHRKKFSFVQVYGEESLAVEDLDLVAEAEEMGENATFALVDMVDGTDLLERGLSNWCSAVIIFQPTAPDGKKILAAFVGLPDKRIYYSSAKNKRVFVCKDSVENRRPVGGCSLVTKLNDASICFYGQKHKALQIFFNHVTSETPTLFDYLKQEDEKRKNTREGKKVKGETPGVDDEDIEFRIYNLAGIPMMVKMIDISTKLKEAEVKSIDLVFDVRGQNPHDVVPGAYLAMKAGATVRKLWKNEEFPNGNYADMSYQDLENSLMRPASKKSKLKYIVASTKELADEITPLILPLVENE